MPILHISGCVGFVIVITMGLITTRVRGLWKRIFVRHPTWSKMLDCPMCFGVWGGIGWGSVFFLREHLPIWLCAVHDVLAFAFTVSLIGFLIALFDHAVGGLGSLKKGYPRPPTYPPKRDNP